MPRAGGESDKLGNRYEGIWSIGQLLDVANEVFESLMIEPIGDEAIGIEFVLQHSDGTRAYHSVKRQHSESEWSLFQLSKAEKKTNRSILGDLIHKLTTNEENRCCFISSTGANDFRELTECAHRRTCLEDFRSDLESSKRLRQAFEKYVLPLTSNDLDQAYSHLQRLEVVLIDEKTLKKQINQQITYLIYRPDSHLFTEREVRVLLGDFILDNLGTEIRHDDIWNFLSEFGYEKRDWATDSTIRNVVRQRNREYVRSVEFELINAKRVPRAESQEILDEVKRDNGANLVLVSADAGVGKSCAISQVIDDLEANNVPVLVVRLDQHNNAHTTKDIGTQLGLPQSPAVVLAGLANGRDSVLVIDQLDAVSQVSGRYPHLWDVFNSLCYEADTYPNMRLVIACRDFDLQHDFRLRKMKQTQVSKHIQIQKLSIEVVNASLKEAGCKESQLSLRENEILKTPLHLFLFLDGLGEDQTEIGFQNLGELFDRYWNRKQKKISERLGNGISWTPVIDKLCQEMSRDLTVYVPVVTVDEWNSIVAAMLTEHVLVRDDQQIRFFHESFFDYAFARRFSANGQSLINFLLSSEQHLFRRSQVRQILVFVRDHSHSRYLVQLRELLSNPNIRFHIKRLILVWLGALSNPTQEEWEIIEPLLGDQDLSRHMLPAIRNSLSWFDLLHNNGVIEKWLQSCDEETINRAVWFLMLNEVREFRSETAAALLTPFRGQSPEWDNRLRAYFRFGKAYCSLPIQKLFLNLLDDGIFQEYTSNENDSWWDVLRDSGENAPLFALEAITQWLDKKIGLSHEEFNSSIYDGHAHDHSATQLINELALREPKAFVDEIFPRVLTIIDMSKTNTGKGLQYDKTWGSLSNAEPTGPIDSLFDALVSALENVASSTPKQIEETTIELSETDSLTITFLLLRSWSANPQYFGDRCIQFMTNDIRRLDVGYGSWGGGGHGHAAISRESIQSCLPHSALAHDWRIPVFCLCS